MKTYYTELEAAKAKLELRKLEKVELGLIDDLDKEYRAAFKHEQKAYAKLKEAYKIVAEARGMYIDVNDGLSKAFKAAKDLGLDNVKELDDLAKRNAREQKGNYELHQAIQRFK